MPGLRLLDEPEGEEVRVPQGEAQADRLPGEGADVPAVAPGHGPVEVIAEDLVALGEAEAGDRLAPGVLDLRQESPRRRGGEVDLPRRQPVA